MTRRIAFSADVQREKFNLSVAFESDAMVTGIFGPSGSGKSTIVDLIAGVVRPQRGRISVSGRLLFDTQSGVDEPVEKRGIGYVFQDARLFPHLTVRSNLIFAQHAKDRARRAAASSSFDKVVALLGLQDYLSRRPGSLSGGEQQRVAIGRALLSGPSLLLMDEPLASLDARRKSEILPYLEQLAADAEVPIIYVSHDFSEINRLARHLVQVEAGRLVSSGPVTEFAHLATREAF